uniref:vitamin-K-epoxide reductase (warfarin-sensitive) n=1 Tax=Phaeomonas parva TaxID=124430 RepID=A0A7S1TWY3_9STRA|mmetsp:Transcript_20713/g.63008  ORF Transcript_20713/g.63008 Transcript_20713/m.63008 type:complete len:172 (+) Transcript_20713:25-540(+)
MAATTRKAEVVLATAGIALSVFALYVEIRKEADEGYEALCDFNEHMSCSKVFTSDYGKFFSAIGIIPKDSILDLPNAAYGTAFFTLFLARPAVTAATGAKFARKLYLGLGASAVCVSLALAYVLRYVLEDFCVVCASSYVVNGGLFAVAAADFLSGGGEGDEVEGGGKKQQ